MALACKVAVSQDINDYNQLTLKETWQTLLFLTDDQASPTGQTGMDIDDFSQPATTWACGFCTFVNSGTGDTCEMCGLPKNS